MKRLAKISFVFLILVAGFALLRGTAPQVATGTWQNGPDMNEARTGAAALTLDDGRVLVFGGHNGSGATNAVQVFSDGSWSDLGAVMLDARSGHTATALADGRILIAGGENSSGPLSSLEIYDPSSGAFSSAGTLSGGRKSHGAARLPSGSVLIIGGSDGGDPSNALASSEIYDPDSGSVSAGPSLSAPRSGLSATRLLDGKILIAGGNNGEADLASTLIYNAADGSFAAGADLSAPRSRHSAVLLPNNNSVLISGGSGSASAELYVPWTGSVSATNAMSGARDGAVGSGGGWDGIAIVAGGGSASSELYGFATVKTDKDDYVPGEVVTMSGSGWVPGETVYLLLQEFPEIHDDRVFNAVADSAGNFSISEFLVEEHHVGVRFYLSAVGAASQAQITFTDGNIKALASPTGVTFTLIKTAYSSSSNCTTGAGSPTTVTGVNSTSGNSTGSVNNGNSLKLEAAATSDQGGAFVNWTGSDPATPALPTTNRIICAAGFTGGGTRTYTANYQPNLSIGNASVTEGGTAMFNVTLSAASNSNVTVDYALAGVTATAGDDFNATGGSLLFTPGQVSKTISVPTVDDNIDEPGPDETFTVTLQNIVGAGVTNSTGTGSITDNDATPVLDIVDSVLVTEGNTGTTNAVFTVTLSGKSSLPVTVDFETQDDSATLADNDYQSNTGTLTFPAINNDTQTITVLVNGDTTPEPSETFRVRLSNQSSNANLPGANRTGVGTIQNDDFGLSIGNASVTEGGTAMLHVTLSPANPSGTVTVDYVIADATAMHGSDYSGPTSGTLTFAASDTDETISVPTTDDNIDEPGPDETFTITLQNPTGGGTITNATGTGSIQDNDATPTLDIVDTVMQNEGNSGTTDFVFTVTLSHPSSLGVSVNFQTADGSALLSDNDYQAQAGSLVWPANNNDAQTITVKVNGDTSIEPNETFAVNLSSPSNAALPVANSQGVGTITNDDFDNTPPTIHCGSPDGLWHNDNVAIHCTAEDTGSGLANPADASFDLTTSVAAGFEDANASTNSRQVCDNAGNCATAGPIAGNMIDRKTPQQSACDVADGLWHNDNVTLHCTYTDGGSGPASQQVALSTSVAAGFEDSNAAASANGAQACDAVGNCAASPVDIPGNMIDRKAPQQTTCESPDGLWHNDNVTLHCNYSDGGSGPADQQVSLSTNVAVGFEDPNASASANGAQACDAVGNCADSPADIPGNMIDRKAPVISCGSPDGLWHATDVTINCTANDGGSGLDNPADASFSLSTTVPADTETNNASTDSHQVCDDVGNCDTAGPISGNMVDKKAPQLSACDSPDGQWHPDNVTLYCTYNDGGSGPASQQVDLNTSIADGVETSNAVASAGGDQACDDVGNCAASPADIPGNMVDRKDPTITLFSRLPAANGFGWNNTNVTVTWTCTDGGSGPASATVSDTKTGEGANQTANGTCYDNVGNSGSDSLGGISIDKTNPTLNPSVTPNPVVLNGSATANAGASDGLSGIDTQSCAAVDTSTVGPHSVACTATDKAGNTANADANYSVIFAPAGTMCLGSPGHQILQPINADGSSVFKQKSTVPAKFRVCDANGMSIGPTPVVTSFQIIGTYTGTLVPYLDPLEVDSTTPDSTFRWSSTDQQWIFNINTKGMQANKTYVFRITLTDGSTIDFMFGLK